MKFQLITKPLSEVKTDYLIYPVFEGEKPSVRDKVLEDFLTDNPKFGKLFESQLLYLKDLRLVLIGVGKKDKFNFVTLQNWVGAATKLSAKKAKQISLILPQSDLTPDEMGEAIAIGGEVAAYDSASLYKTDYEANKLSTIEIVLQRAERGYLEGIKKGQIIAESINLSRRLGDLAANEMTPTYFLNLAKKLAKENKLKLTVLDEKMAAKKGMGAFAGIAKGSDEPSFMIALEYRGEIKSKEKWGLVGKGVTFDSGGLSLKPSDKMHEMKYDMVGAADVLAAIVAIAKLGLKTNVVAIMPVTENLPGGKALKPGDIVKTYSGKTAEILNTDAEGRVVLIDGVTYAQKDFKATKIIDLASLTGAIILALGDFIAGAFSNNPKFVNDLVVAGAKVGEKFWEMPMDDEFGEMIKGSISDIENIGHGGSMGSRTAGPITGAKFIGEGLEGDIPWIHLDIAGVAWDMKPRPFRNPGATGMTVKTLLKLIES